MKVEEDERHREMEEEQKDILQWVRGMKEQGMDGEGMQRWKDRWGLMDMMELHHMKKEERTADEVCNVISVVSIGDLPSSVSHFVYQCLFLSLILICHWALFSLSLVSWIVIVLPIGDQTCLIHPIDTGDKQGMREGEGETMAKVI